MPPRDCTDQELFSTVATLVGLHREMTAKLVAYLAEIEERRLHLMAGFSSMFELCTKQLGMSEGEAFRRILAARLGRRFPLVYSLLATGDVHLSALELLRDHLTDENHAELLRASAGKSKREVEALVARRFPRPDVPTRVHAARVEPLSEQRFRVEFTAGADLVGKLERCRDLLSHANPSGDLAVVVERAVDLLLSELQAKRFATLKRSARATNPAHLRSRRIPNAVRRRVFERDGAQCTYVSPEGRRCESRSFLELDHVEARALGGDHRVENLRVLCRAHNQLHAEETFGRVHIDRQRHLRQRKCGPRSATWDKVLVALRNLGFREGQAQRAVAAVGRVPDADLPVEEALRAALKALADTQQ
jgi:hypothetical protein